MLHAGRCGCRISGLKAVRDSNEDDVKGGFNWRYIEKKKANEEEEIQSSVNILYRKEYCIRGVKL